MRDALNVRTFVMAFTNSQVDLLMKVLHGSTPWEAFSTWWCEKEPRWKAMRRMEENRSSSDDYFEVQMLEVDADGISEVEIDIPFELVWEKRSEVSKLERLITDSRSALELFNLVCPNSILDVENLAKQKLSECREELRVLEEAWAKETAEPQDLTV